MNDIEYYAFVNASLVVLKKTIEMAQKDSEKRPYIMAGLNTQKELEAIIKETEKRLLKANGN